jgi:hypothetical protein
VYLYQLTPSRSEDPSASWSTYVLNKHKRSRAFRPGYMVPDEAPNSKSKSSFI